MALSLLLPLPKRATTGVLCAQSVWYVHISHPLVYHLLLSASKHSCFSLFFAYDVKGETIPHAPPKPTKKQVMIALIYTCLEIPFTLGFGLTLSLDDTMGKIAFSIDLFLLCDVIVNFRTAFFDEYDSLLIITDGWEIAKRYPPPSPFPLFFFSSVRYGCTLHKINIDMPVHGSY